MTTGLDPELNARLPAVIVGSDALSDQEVFLLSILAQLYGTVIAKRELIAAGRASSRRAAALNVELETTASTLAKIMQTHRRLNEIAARGGEAGIARTLCELTTPVPLMPASTVKP